MSVDIRSSDRRRYMDELQAREKEIAAGLLKASQPASSPNPPQESDKRVRREIANSNERRRMQCINAGYSSLRALIPQLEGEKLSKAAILLHTTEYITSLEKEKTRLQIQLERSNQLLSECGHDRMITDSYISNSPPPTKRKKRDTESSDEGVGSLSDASDEGGAELRQENMELRHQLEVERRRIASLEEQSLVLESQLISVINMNSNHHSIRDVEAITVEATYPPLRATEPVYSREVVEVIGSGHSPTQESSKPYLPPPRPMSPTPERGMPMNICEDLVEYNTQPDLCSPDLNIERPSVALTPESAVPPASTITPPVVKPTTEAWSPHHHNYCHRDHPRRRLRQQAQLEQQREEEELKRQRIQQQEMVVGPAAFRPKHSAQNLENLVEAIRQIEGDRVLCQMEGERTVFDERRLYEEEERLYTHRKSIPSTEESKREISSISHQEDIKYEISGHNSPPARSQQHPYLHQSQPPSVSPAVNHIINTIPISSNTSSFSEKYPIASHLLHRPLHHPIYRRGVIVHKQ